MPVADLVAKPELGDHPVPGPGRLGADEDLGGRSHRHMEAIDRSHLAGALERRPSDRRSDLASATRDENCGVPHAKALGSSRIARFQALEENFLVAGVLGHVEADDVGCASRDSAGDHRSCAAEVRKRALRDLVRATGAGEHK
jgi:hypothetical protein